MNFKELMMEIRSNYVERKYDSKEENLHRDIQRDIDDYWFDLSEYDLAHLCKEWAWKYKFIINSSVTTSNDWCTTTYLYNKTKVMKTNYTWENTEPEAVFKACQWILDNNLKDK